MKSTIGGSAGLILLGYVVITGCGSAGAQPKTTIDRQSETSAPDETFWQFEGATEAFTAIRAQDWGTAWGLLREIATENPAAAYLFAVTEAQEGNPEEVYRALKQLRELGGSSLPSDLSASVTALEKWSLPAVLGTNTFCTRNPKNLGTPACADENMVTVERYCLEYRQNDLACKLALGSAKEKCAGLAWYFDHMDNPVKPDNLARCTARKLFADHEFGPVPEVFLPAEARSGGPEA